MYRFFALIYAAALTGTPVADTTGDDYTITPKWRGELPQEPTWAVKWKITISGGTDPTAQLYIETSNDGTNWYRRSISATCTGAGTVHGLTVFTPCKYIRPFVDVGGTAAPTAVTVRAELVCTRAFEIAAVT